MRLACEMWMGPPASSWGDHKDQKGKPCLACSCSASCHLRRHSEPGRAAPSSRPGRGTPGLPVPQTEALFPPLPETGRRKVLRGLGQQRPASRRPRVSVVGLSPRAHAVPRCSFPLVRPTGSWLGRRLPPHEPAARPPRTQTQAPLERHVASCPPWVSALTR